MHRNCSHIEPSKDGTRAIYIDTKNGKEILKYFAHSDARRKRYRTIKDRLLSGKYGSELYRKVKGTDNITEIRLNVGGINDRIYCQEIKSSTGVFIVVMVILHRKTAETWSRTEQQIIDKIEKYEYEIR